MNVSRINRVIENMKAEGLSQILVTAPASVFYLTGEWVEPGERMFALHVKDDGSVMLYANRLFALNGNVDVPLTEFDDTDDCVAILAKGIDAGKIGIDKVWPSQFTIRLMEAREDIRPVLGSRPVDEARMLKDEEEVRLMLESSQKNVEVCRRTMEALQEGMTENEVQEIYIKIASELGTSGPSFEPLVCFGANCAEPHHASDGTKLKKGDAVILDVGVLWNRYCSDMTRTCFFGGEPTEEEQKVYDIVYAANRAAIAAAKPGVKMKDIDLAARKVIEDAGYGPYFIHRTGHGIGLEVHEHPDCSATNETIARPGMIFSIEPGIYLPGKFGVRYEDLIVITEDGCTVLTQ
ncbi:MAG: aminopeptidase P family protein [Clostridiales bacterium]|nr:aminopeptidase P family protein [Clostridiales bacterium]